MRLLPRDQKFFDLFTASATLSVQAARYLRELLDKDESGRMALADTIKKLEREADQITHEVVGRLDRTFITPLDREDIHMLASRLDDVMDLMDGTARRIQMFHAGQAPEGAAMLTDVIHRANIELLGAVQGLEKDRTGVVLAACKTVKHLEEEGDSLYHEWVGKLFERESDPMQVIKWMEIYEHLERTLDQAEDVSNVLESIFIKHA